MSKRFYFDEFSEDIFDDEIQQYPSNQTICNILNQQQEQIADLETKLAEKEKAFDLMSIVLCTGARDDLKRQIGQFTLRKQVKEFFLKQAKKELENGEKY